jgi:hypothetical protein
VSLTVENTLGVMSAVTVLAPIAPGGEPALRAHLEGLGTSPLSQLPGTHFGRWAIVDDFVADPDDRRPDRLGCAYLLFTATADGTIDAYLAALAALPEARAIWSHCIGCPDGAGLAAYLEHNRIDTGLFFAASPGATVAQVCQSLRTREQAIDLALRTQGMEPADAQRAFLEEFGPR